MYWLLLFGLTALSSTALGTLKVWSVLIFEIRLDRSNFSILRRFRSVYGSLGLVNVKHAVLGYSLCVTCVNKSTLVDSGALLDGISTPVEFDGFCIFSVTWIFLEYFLASDLSIEFSFSDCSYVFSAVIFYSFWSRFCSGSGFEALRSQS